MRELTKELLRVIDETTQEEFNLGTRKAAKKKEGSRRNAYEKGIREVEEIAGKPSARELADWIQGEIRTKNQFPSARRVRKLGAKICREKDT